MKTFLVWEDECAEDGSFEIEAVDEDDAIRRYRAEGVADDVEISACLLTTEEAVPRVGSLLSDALSSVPEKRTREIAARVDEAIRILTIARAQSAPGEKGAEG